MKSSKHATNRIPPPPAGLRGLIRNFLGIFADPLPVSTVRGKGKYLTEVVCRGEAQARLEQLCGGRSPKGHRRRTMALVVPAGTGTPLRVTIDCLTVGELKPKDARFLLGQMVKTHAEPFALSVNALIEGGAQKKGKSATPFTLRLDLPVPPAKSPTKRAARDE